MPAANQHTGTTCVKAQQEIQVMRCLLDRPKTAREISEDMGIKQNRVKHLLQGLKAAECVVKVPNSHAVELVSFNV